MIQRVAVLHNIQSALKRAPVVALLGPRQCGKTTLARHIVPPDSENYFDLEDPFSLERLAQPKAAFDFLKGIVVIDEVQRKPDLFPILRVLADRRPLRTRCLILGSASPDLLKQSSESLAGRLEIIPMSGFTLKEVGFQKIEKLWIRGGYPVSFLSRSDADSMTWRKNFVQTILERDLPMLGVRFPAPLLFRLWAMLAHYHGQVWNGAEIARSLEVSEPTVKRYVEFLEGLFLVRQLKPWFANVGKRQVKSPKLYIRDSGVLHYFLGAENRRALLVNPRMGASWEGFVIEEILKAVPHDDAFFWATQNQAEIDLVLLRKGKLVGIECKRTDTPRLTPSMRNALRDLPLDHIWVIHPGTRSVRLDKKVTALSLEQLLRQLT